MSILVFTPQITSRIKYAFHVLLHETCGIYDVKFTVDENQFKAAEGAKINYSHQYFDECINFIPHGLLLEKDISEHEIFVKRHLNTPIFFSVSKSILPFDPFAASFYLVSRYEEYLPHISDQHNRFMATESLAYKNDFLEIPVVNIWAGWVKELILKQFPNTVFKARKYNFVSTVDVDNLFAYKGKGLFRTSGALVKDLAGFQFKRIKERTSSILGYKRDPYDTFEAQMAMNDEHNIDSIYFMLFAEFAQYDRNISMYSPRMQVAVRGMNDYTTIGIHPSYRSNESDKIVETEIRQLEETLRSRVTKSRQHFLKMTFPDTFKKLVEFGVTDEYSMGYASESGFRASIATPYTFYDLEMEVPIPLKMHPFMVMDVTFIDYKVVDKQQTLDKIESLVDQVKAVNGQFISVFHNRIFSETEPEWKGWKKIYRQMLAYAKP